MKMKKNRKGISAVGVLLILVLIAAVVFVIWLALHGGFGLGKGSGKAEGEGKSTESTQVTESTESADKNIAEPATAEFTEIEVIITGDKYSFNGTEYDLDGVMAEIEKIDNPIVTITDNGGLANSLDALTAKLTEKNISYTDNTASAADASEEAE